MKALVKLNTVVDGNKVTITGELMDVAMPPFIGQRTTIMHPVNGDMDKPRHIQVNTHGIVVLRHGTDGVLLPKDELASIAIEIDSKLTDAPVFREHPTADNLVGVVHSELPATAQLQQSDDGKTWADVQGDHKDYKPQKGKHYRCVVTNKAGKTESNPIKAK